MTRRLLRIHEKSCHLHPVKTNIVTSVSFPKERTGKTSDALENMAKAMMWPLFHLVLWFKKSYFHQRNQNEAVKDNFQRIILF